MKEGLPVIPDHEALEKAYEHLLHERLAPPGPEDLARYSQWCRFDPRLAEIWVAHLAHRWECINPLSLRACLQVAPWPAAAAVLLEFCRLLVKRARPGTDSKVFEPWRRLVTVGIEKAGGEQFFIGLRQLGGNEMRDDAIFSLREYSRWGYLGREVLINKASATPLTREQRAEILSRLLERSPRIRTKDYWTAIGKCVSRRQAERDLARCPWVQQRGRTKGKYFVRSGPLHPGMDPLRNDGDEKE